MLIEVLMIDANRKLAEARRFRARIVALTLAENGAELAARNIVFGPSSQIVPPTEDWQGTISGEMRKTGRAFDIVGKGQSKGLDLTQARVHIEGRIEPSAIQERVVIEYTRHSQ